MICKEFRGALIELSRGGLFDVNERARAVSHVSVCMACSRFFDAQLALTTTETALAGETVEISPPPELEALLRAEYAFHLRTRGGRFAKSATALAIAAALICAWLATPRRGWHAPEVASSAGFLPVAPPPVTAEPERRTAVRSPVRKRPAAPSRRPAQQAADSVEAPFVAIPYTIPLDPHEQAAVVRMEMPVAALTAVGLSVPTPDSSASAMADVIVGRDGRMRAIRLLSISNPNSERSNSR
jgi:hypothetical protein